MQEQIPEGQILLVHVVEIAARRQVRRMAPDVSDIERQVVPQFALDTECPTQNLRQARSAREQPVYALVVLEIRYQLRRPIVVLREAAGAPVIDRREVIRRGEAGRRRKARCLPAVDRLVGVVDSRRSPQDGLWIQRVGQAQARTKAPHPRFVKPGPRAARPVAGKNERARNADRVHNRGTKGTHLVLDLVRSGSDVPAETVRQA